MLILQLCFAEFQSRILLLRNPFHICLGKVKGDGQVRPQSHVQSKRRNVCDSLLSTWHLRSKAHMSFLPCVATFTISFYLTSSVRVAKWFVYMLYDTQIWVTILHQSKDSWVFPRSSWTMLHGSCCDQDHTRSRRHAHAVI